MPASCRQLWRGTCYSKSNKRTNPKTDLLLTSQASSPSSLETKHRLHHASGGEGVRTGAAVALVAAERKEGSEEGSPLLEMETCDQRREEGSDGVVIIRGGGQGVVGVRVALAGDGGGWLGQLI